MPRSSPSSGVSQPHSRGRPSPLIRPAKGLGQEGLREPRAGSSPVLQTLSYPNLSKIRRPSAPWPELTV